MQMIVIPAHQQLDDPVQVRDRHGVRQPDPAPNRRMDIPQQEFQLQQHGTALFDHTPTIAHQAQPCPAL